MNTSGRQTNKQKQDMVSKAPTVFKVRTRVSFARASAPKPKKTENAYPWVFRPGMHISRYNKIATVNITNKLNTVFHVHTAACTGCILVVCVVVCVYACMYSSNVFMYGSMYDSMYVW